MHRPLASGVGSGTTEPRQSCGLETDSGSLQSVVESAGTVDWRLTGSLQSVGESAGTVDWRLTGSLQSVGESAGTVDW